MSWLGKQPSPIVVSGQQLADKTVSPAKLSLGAPSWSAGGLLTPGAGIDLSATGQIKFPASQSASADANTLDDYEEGTWSPTLITDGGGQSVTYTQQRGTYTKIGRVVTLSWYVGWSAFTGGSAGVRVGNLPFPSQSAGPGVYYAGANAEHNSAITYDAGYSTLTYEIGQSTSAILPVQNGSGKGTLGFQRGNFATTSGYLIGSLTYETT